MKSITIRIENDLGDALKKHSEAGFRSVSAEVVKRLTESASADKKQ